MADEKRLVVLDGKLSPAEAYKNLKTREDLSLEEKSLCISTLIFKSEEFKGYVDEYLSDGKFIEDLKNADVVFQHKREDVNGKPYIIKLSVEEVVDTTLSKAEKEMIYADPALLAEYTEPIIVSKKTSQAILEGRLVLGGVTITPKRGSKFVQKVVAGSKGTKAKKGKK